GGPVVYLKNGLQHIIATAYGLDDICNSCCNRLVLNLIRRRHKLLMPGRLQRPTKSGQQAGKVWQRLRCLRRGMSPGKKHELAEGMDIDEYIYSALIAKCVNILRFRFGKRECGAQSLLF